MPNIYRSRSQENMHDEVEVGAFHESEQIAEYICAVIKLKK